MALTIRPKVYKLPAYSLTGDLLSFLRCGLQYRYDRLSKLPPTRPVQLWFGQFIHSVLEESFHHYKREKEAGRDVPPPWPTAVVDSICQRVETRLAAEGLKPWTKDMADLGRGRAEAAINDLGPHLFPLIKRAEVRLTGSREIPKGAPGGARVDHYEIVGVVDVVSHVELADPSLAANPLVQRIRAALPKSLPDKFEVIIDYKGSRRPTKIKELVPGLTFWDVYEWQVQTYAHLRQKQPGSAKVLAGMLVYVNELHPGKTDIGYLKDELKIPGATDVVPAAGSPAAAMLAAWKSKDPAPALPFDFRMSRAVHVVPVNDVSLKAGLAKFDAVVAQIEQRRQSELATGKIIPIWDKNDSDRPTCLACDARTYCTEFKEETAPSLPFIGA